MDQVKSLLDATRPTALRQFLSTERWRWSLAGSLLLHVVVILGIGFVLPKASELEWIAPLSVTLVNLGSDKAPQDTALLAQTDSFGGGIDDSPTRIIASLPLANQPNSIVPQQTEKTGLMTETAAGSEPEPQLLTTNQADDTPWKAAPARRPMPSDSERLQQIRKQMLANLGAAQRTVLKGLREKYLGAQTKAYKYAHYMEQWRIQVEEIGNLNYPDEAQRQGLSGALVLDVGIHADGTIQNVRIARSSGSKVLDDAAQRIVHLASPFAPFPETFAGEVDVLHMVRTWEFQHNRLTSQ